MRDKKGKEATERGVRGVRGVSVSIFIFAAESDMRA